MARPKPTRKPIPPDSNKDGDNPIPPFFNVDPVDAAEIRYAAEELRKVINEGWEIWLMTVGRRIESLPDYSDDALASTPEVSGMGQAIDLKVRAGLALRTLYRHGYGPASLQSRSLEDALGLFPEYPQGAIKIHKDKQFVAIVRIKLPALRELDDDLHTFLSDLDYSPKSVIGGSMYRLTKGQASGRDQSGAQQGEGGKPVDDAFGELREFARTQLRGQERAVIEALCNSGGELPIPDLAIKRGVDWSDAKEQFKSVQRRLKPKLKRQRWALQRVDNAAKLTALKRG